VKERGDETGGKDVGLRSEKIDGPENWVRGEMFKEYVGSI
jgi:hypothetical protein